MKTTEVNKELIGRRCECIFTGLMVTGVIEDTEENEHTIEVKVQIPIEEIGQIIQFCDKMLSDNFVTPIRTLHFYTTYFMEIEKPPQ